MKRILILISIWLFIAFIYLGIGLLVFPSSQTINVVKLKATDAYGQTWKGTAFFVADNLLMTAGHCVEDANSIILVTADGMEIFADNWYQENDADVGLIDVNTLKIEQQIEFDDPILGETVRAIGNPYSYFPVITQGIISAIEVEGYYYSKNLFITNCSTFPGNSGCPIFDKNNNVLGICSWGPLYEEGMTFCVPAKICQLVLKKYQAIKALEEAE